MSALRALVLVIACGAAACGGAKSAAQAPVLPQASPQAVTKLAQGVEAAREPNGKQRAMGLFKEAIGADERLWEARYNLGVLLCDSGDLRSAERELEKAHELAPNAEDVAVALSEVRRRRGDHAGAIDVLRRFVQQHPRAATASIALVTALREGGKVKESIEQAHRVLVQNASDPYALSELALAHLELGELDTAELLSGEALKTDQKSAAAYRAAALVALKRGDDAVAFRHFARASEIDPRDTTARLNMAIVLLKAGVYDRAAEELRSVLAAEPDNNAAALGLAAARRAQGTRDDSAPFLEAEKLLKGVLEREPKNLSATFNLALLYAEHLNKASEAQPLLKRFLEDAPSEHPARGEAERLLSGKK